MMQIKRWLRGLRNTSPKNKWVTRYAGWLLAGATMRRQLLMEVTGYLWK